MNPKTDYILQKVKAALLTIDAQARIILFGSRARGEAGEESDWDFLFLTRLPVTIGMRQQIVAQMLSIELEQGIIIQVLPKNDSQWAATHRFTPLFTAIEREGIAV